MSRQDATSVWLKVVSDLLDKGRQVSPRDQGTRELMAYKSAVDMNYPLVEVPARKIGRKFRAAEAAWILSGDNRVETIAPFSKEISRFSDDGQTFFGAYGPQLLPQLDYVVTKLAEDPDTRQAVATIWQRSPQASKDIPCTVAVQFIIRNNRLNCIDTMRSSDIWLGWPYDIFNFSMLSYYIIKRLRREHGIRLGLGRLTLVAGSQHLYDRNLDAARSLNLHISEEPRLVTQDTWDLDDRELVDWLWTQAHGEGI
jgi:thymidylate synthase